MIAKLPGSQEKSEVEKASEETEDDEGKKFSLKNSL